MTLASGNTLPDPSPSGPSSPPPVLADAPVLGLLGEWARRVTSPVLLLGEGAAGARILHANPAFCAAIGMAATEVLGRPLRAVLPHLEASGHLRALDRLRGIGAGRHRRAILRFALSPAIPPRLWSVEATPLASAATRPPAPLLLQLRGLGPERRAAAETDPARATLDALFAHIPEGLILAEGRDARIRRVSAHGLALAGQAEEAVLGRGASQHPTDWAVLRADGRTPARPDELPLTRAARRGETVQHETWVLRRATDGALVPILCSAGPIRDGEGRVTGAILAWRDVTELHRARAALAASEARYRTLAETMPHLVWQTDAGGRPEFMNQRMRAFTGLSPETAADGERLAARLHPEDLPRLTADWRLARERGAELDVDARFAAPEGGWRWFRILGAPVHDEAGRVSHWVGTCTDIEDSRRNEAVLRAAAEAQQALARMADHRIKNSLQLVASLLRLKAGRLGDPAARAALEAAVVRVQAVAEAHRALSRGPDLSTLRVADMLEELAAGAARQRPGADIATEAPPDLMLDAERAIPLALVLKELATRALGDGRPAGAVRLSARVLGGAEALEVAVQGPGLDRRPQAGAEDGVGETIMCALIRQIGASLASEATVGEDPCAVLRLPLAVPEAPPES